MDDIRNRISMDTLIENKHPGYEKESFIREEISFIQILFEKKSFPDIKAPEKEEKQKIKPLKNVLLCICGQKDQITKICFILTCFNFEIKRISSVNVQLILNV